MPETRKTKKDKIVTPVKSVHVVFFSCQHCGEEIEDIKMCPECGKPMRVIDVVEKFGDEADEFLKKVKDRMKEIDHEDDFVTTDSDEEPNIILMGADDSALDSDGGLDAHSADDDGLDVIFPDDSGDDSHFSGNVAVDDDLSDALAQLDSEEEENVSAEDFGFDKDEIPEL